MRIISKYILKEALLYFSISLLIFTGVLLTVRMLRFAALIVNKGVDPIQILHVFLSIVPAFLEIAIPLATLLGLMLAFGRLSGDSEIVVLRASGISLGELVLPVIFFGITAVAAATWVTHSLSPWGYQILSQTLFDIAKSRSTAGLNDGVFNRLGNMHLYLDHIDHTSGLMTKVLLDDRREQDNGQGPRKIIIAASGKVTSDVQAQTLSLELYNGHIHEIIDGKYVLTKFDTNSVVFNSNEILDPKSQNKGRSPKEMTVKELRAEIDNYEAALVQVRLLSESTPAALESIAKQFKLKQPMGKLEIKKRMRKLEVEIQRRFAMPYAPFVLSLLALPLGIYPPRSHKTWGAGLSALFGFAVFILYYAMLSIGMALAENGILPAVLGLWIPNIVTCLLAVYFIIQVATEKWQSILHGVEQLCLSIKWPKIKLTKA